MTALPRQKTIIIGDDEEDEDGTFHHTKTSNCQIVSISNIKTQFSVQYS